MNTILNNVSFRMIIFAFAFGLSFYFGYNVKSNAVDKYNARQEIKLASLQSKYDEVSVLTRGDYLTAFNGVISQYESNPVTNNNDNRHDLMWHLFVKHTAGEVSKNKPTCRVDETTARSLENGKLNTIQLLFLQSYINQIKGLDK